MTENPEKTQAEIQSVFAIIGVGGYIAPRHLQAIKDTGNLLVAAFDPNDSVGILDRYFNDVHFFTEFERFDRHIEKLRRIDHGAEIDYVSICSPNYLHDAHVRFAFRIGADAICEKPLVLNPWNLDALKELEEETGRRVWTVLQLRYHPAIVELRNRIQSELKEDPQKRYTIDLTYITPRGRWYDVSWKGDVHKSGGVATNIGVHFFDMLMWIFGKVDGSQVHLRRDKKMSGFLRLEHADVRWYLSLDRADLPDKERGNNQAYRSITVDGDELEFSGGFTDLHTVVYQETLKGNGFGIDDVYPSIELIHALRTQHVEEADKDSSHNFLQLALDSVEEVLDD